MQGGHVGPLQVVQKDDQWVFLLRENPNEVLKNQMKAVARFGGWQFGNGQLFTDDQFDFGDDVDDHLAVGTEGGHHAVLPVGHGLAVFGQDLAYQFGESLDQGRIGQVALELIELTGKKDTASGGDRFIEFVDQRRLADARTSRDQEQA